VPIDVYNISLNGETILKQYTADIKDSKGGVDDQVFEIEFRKFYDCDDNLIAWLWFGLTHFKGQIIRSKNTMRGLRLRKDNIQIGGEDALQKLFKEDRGNSYFVGEVFAVWESLVPNSQRDYFNENPARFEFEQQLRQFFNEELYHIYYAGSTINAKYKALGKFEAKKEVYEKKQRDGTFLDAQHQKKEKQLLDSEQEKAIKAKDIIAKQSASPKNDAARKVIEQINKQHNVPIFTEKPSQPKEHNIKESQQIRRVDPLSHYSNQERKLISRIYDVLTSNLDRDIAERLIEKIEEELT
jgi:molecular chaperone HtpG